MLEIDGLTVAYGKMTALRDVSMAIRADDMVALLGGNGAGKSTLLDTISGLVQPEKGEIRWQGQSLRGLGPDIICSLGIIQVPEGRKLFPAMTVEENLLMGAYLPAARKVRRQSLDWVYSHMPHLAQRRRQRAGSLSGGEQQMVAIGRALMARPRLLMLDEPSLGLSPRASAEVFAIVSNLNREGMTTIIVSQEVQETLSITSYAYVMENGGIALHGPSAALREDPEIKKSYLGL
ncbi:MAG TPA: ABC transporter ATP-binding protein [Syntrophales bacterium]|nr:ABC transporter ATP-binding protein [Syntrophales bacterium]